MLGSSDSVVQIVSVVQCIAAVTGATLLAAGQYPVSAVESAKTAELEPVLPEAHAESIPAKSENPASQAIAAIGSAHGLSEREMQVMELLAMGNTRLGVAEKLVISENTVRVHVKNIYGKLGIHSKQQLVDMVDRKVHAPK